MNTSIDKYLLTYSGRDLLKYNNYPDEGIWEVRGEDPNPDLGGSHHNPILGYYEGTLENVLKVAVDLPGFWQWGAGGKIRKINIEKV